MLGDGTVNFGTAVVVADLRNVNASPKIVFSNRTRPSTFNAAEVKNVVPSVFLKGTWSCSSLREIPPNW